MSLLYGESRRVLGLAGAERFRSICLGLVSCLVLVSASTCAAQEGIPPKPVLHLISIQLDSSGRYLLSADDLARITEGSSDPSGITNISAVPSSFGFCDVGLRQITVSLTDSFGNKTNGTVSLRVLPPL